MGYFFSLDVFVIALWSGNHKPSNEVVDEFFDELNLLQLDGIDFQGKTYSVKLKALICDAPARELVKCVVGHTGYHSCERCNVRGEWEGRVVFNIHGEYEYRTRERFNAMAYYPEHQKGEAPLVRLQYFDPVSDVVLDYMHLVCLGFVRCVLIKLSHRWSTYMSSFKSTN